VRCFWDVPGTRQQFWADTLPDSIRGNEPQIPYVKAQRLNLRATAAPYSRCPVRRLVDAMLRRLTSWRCIIIITPGL